MSIRLLIVDDHRVVRQGLRMFLSGEPDIDIVGEAADGEQALRQVEALSPTVVLMDLLMPGMDGVQATAAIRRTHPEVEVVALTSVLEDRMVVEAVRAGAIGYLLKDTEAEDVGRAIRAAAAGQVHIAPQAAAYLVRAVRVPEATDPLTERETDVLRLLAKGRANKEISAALGIGDATVRTHVSSILAKLGVQSRTQAALLAVRLGLVEDSGAC